MKVEDLAINLYHQSLSTVDADGPQPPTWEELLDEEQQRWKNLAKASEDFVDRLRNLGYKG